MPRSAPSRRPHGELETALAEKAVDSEDFSGQPPAELMARTPHGAGIRAKKKELGNYPNPSIRWRKVDGFNSVSVTRIAMQRGCEG